jgi:antitoxin (DNA-binding transcriptional repressor) of toxin-antitoxin stability system
LAWRLAFERGERIEITPFGRRVARLVRVLRTLAGVPT